MKKKGKTERQLDFEKEGHFDDTNSFKLFYHVFATMPIRNSAS